MLYQQAYLLACCWELLNSTKKVNRNIYINFRINIIKSNAMQTSQINDKLALSTSSYLFTFFRWETIQLPFVLKSIFRKLQVKEAPIEGTLHNEEWRNLIDGRHAWIDFSSGQTTKLCKVYYYDVYVDILPYIFCLFQR